MAILIREPELRMSRAFVLPNPNLMVCFTPWMLKVSQSEAWSIPFSITGFKEVSLWVAISALNWVVSATKKWCQIGGPGGLAVGVTRRQVASMEAGQEDTLWATCRLWSHLASERLERYTELKKCQAVAAFTKPYVCFVAVCSSFTKKACRDSLLLRMPLKYKNECVMYGYGSKWLEKWNHRS